MVSGFGKRWGRWWVERGGEVTIHPGTSPFLAANLMSGGQITRNLYVMCVPYMYNQRFVCKSTKTYMCKVELIDHSRNENKKTHSIPAQHFLFLSVDCRVVVSAAEGDGRGIKGKREAPAWKSKICALVGYSLLFSSKRIFSDDGQPTLHQMATKKQQTNEEFAE